MRLTDEITIRLLRHLRRRQLRYIMPNIYIKGRECDVYAETTSGYSHEYEIKVSYADYKNDLQKGRKHQLLMEGKRVNRFYYVVPFVDENNKIDTKNIITVDIIPPYAGLIYYVNGRFYTEKEAPLLSKVKISHQNAVLKSAYHRYVHYFNKATGELIL